MNRKMATIGAQLRGWVPTLTFCVCIFSSSSTVVTAKGLFGFRSHQSQGSQNSNDVRDSKEFEAIKASKDSKNSIESIETMESKGSKESEEPIEPVASKNSNDSKDSKDLELSRDSTNAALRNHHHITRQILINSPVDVVWQTVHIERDCAPNLVYNNLVRADADHVTYEQKWTVIPFFSTTTCQVDEKEIPNERIDFKLVKSDVLKRLEGSWRFAPAQDGRSTLLTLDACIELKRTGPKIFMNAIASKKMDQRLAHVKELAEARHDSVQVSGQVL